MGCQRERLQSHTDHARNHEHRHELTGSGLGTPELFRSVALPAKSGATSLIYGDFGVLNEPGGLYMAPRA